MGNPRGLPSLFHCDGGVSHVLCTQTNTIGEDGQLRRLPQHHCTFSSKLLRNFPGPMRL